MKHFIYVPALSTGTIADGFRKDLRFKDGKSIRFYHEDYNPQFYYPRYLITAGHYYKKGFLLDKFGLDKKKNLILGDSGGFQIANGTLKYSDELVDTIFHWLEDNSTVAVNLDIPPRINYSGKFHESLKLSEKHFKYFFENQSGKTKFLNVLQGDSYADYSKWYDMAQQFQFKGWALGGLKGDIFKMFSAFAFLLEQKELMKPNVEYLHILGTSRFLDFILLEQFQKSIHKINPKLQITADSSSPSRIAAMGGWYFDSNWNTLTYKTLSISNRNKYDVEKGFPYSTQFDLYLANQISFKEILEWSQPGYVAITLHNLHFILDVYYKILYMLDCDEQLIEQTLPSNVFQLLKVVDEMVASDNPRKVLDANVPLITKIAQKFINTVNDSHIKNFFG